MPQIVLQHEDNRKFRYHGQMIYYVGNASQYLSYYICSSLSACQVSVSPCLVYSNNELAFFCNSSHESNRDWRKSCFRFRCHFHFVAFIFLILPL
jgi:hypothetical protein